MRASRCPLPLLALLMSAANADCTQVFVSNETSGDVSVIDTTKLVGIHGHRPIR